MAIANYLKEIKAAGLYRFIFDKSQLPAREQESLRLVVGYSEKGPFNTPVFCETAADFKKIYGDVSKKLERYGCFFHRSALQALEAGPIFALNVKNFTDPSDEPEETDASTGSGNGVDHVSGLTFNATEISETDPYHVTEIYDKTRFWYLEPKNLIRLGDNATKYMTLCATDSKAASNTVFIRAYKPKGYNITFKEWYASAMNGEELPSYLEGYENEKLEDYFVKIYVFKGKITKSLAETDFYKKYFCKKNGENWDCNFGEGEDPIINSTVKNAFGEDVDALDMFCTSSKSNFVNVYSGIVFPDMVSAKNMPLSIDSYFNADNDNHKMMLNLDVEMLYNEDIIKDIKMIGDDSKFAPNDETDFYDDGSEALTGHYLEGYTYSNEKPRQADPDNDIFKDDNKREWQESILDALKGIKDGDKSIGYKGLRIALTDRKSIVYHYLIDTFKTYLGQDVKGLFTNICKDKQNAIALCNFPEINLFKDVQDKSGNYTYIENNTVNFDKIVKDADAFSLPDEENGAAFSSFNTCLVLQNPVTLVKTIIPSAALVSNNFMQKYVNRLPYSIVAGENYGKIEVNNLVGPDYIFSKDDLYALEPFGVNCMVYEPKKGTYINSNQTAKQNPESALSRLHIMELVIFLQDEIEAMLRTYQWEFNDDVLRDTIKKKADVILNTAKGNRGIYDFFTQCDEKNNPVEVVENEMVILDYGIEPAYGAGKMVQQLTIYRTGGISLRTLS